MICFAISYNLVKEKSRFLAFKFRHFCCIFKLISSSQGDYYSLKIAITIQNFCITNMMIFDSIYSTNI